METQSAYQATKQDVEKWISVWNTHDRSQIAALFADDLLMHQPQNPQPLTKDKMLDYFGMLFTAYADIQFTSEGTTIQGNDVASWERVTDTMTGEFHDPATGNVIPPTNKSFKVSGAIHLVYNDAGLINSVRIYWDRLDLYTQLGLLNA